jgi:L-alanine-DL-glutamate epimerase-like enolase superfamily enzyme
MIIAAVETLRLEEFPNILWVILEDAEGNRGLGETFFGARAVEAYIHESVAPKLAGREISGPEELRRRLKAHVGHQGSGVETRGNSAIDIALWDLWGRRTGAPLWQLMGGRNRDRIRAYNTCAGYRYVRAVSGQHSSNWGLGAAEGPYEDLEAFLADAGALAESLLAEGFTGMKIWPFDRYAEASHGMAITPDQLAEGCEPFRKIRAAVGDRIQIMLELHGEWSAPAAVEIARAVAPYNVAWIEDPIPMSNFGVLADLRARVPMKVTASETVAGRRQFLAMIEARAVDVVMLDLSWCGGVTEAKAIAAIAEAAELPVAPHDCTGPVVWAASCHLSLHAPNALIQECVRAFFTGWYRELASGLPVVEAGTVRPAGGPGHGVTLKPGLFERADAQRRRSG